MQNTLTVREVKVMHMPPKPLKVRAMKIRTESSANNKNVTSLSTTKLTVNSFKYRKGTGVVFNVDLPFGRWAP